MLGINRLLKQLADEGNYIKVGLVGAGQMGRGMISQIEKMKGMRVVITADINVDNARKAYQLAGLSEEKIKQSSDEIEATSFIKQDGVVITNQIDLVTSIEAVDVVVDATGIPDVGATIAYQAIQNRKHIVMLNVETDVTVGPILKSMADAAGVVYTGSAGDEPGAIMELYDFADAMGFNIVTVGKGKNNKLNLEANPASAEEEAKQKGSSSKMLASFQDGTKTMVEMTAVANAIGFLPDVAGMHGPSASVEELPTLLIPKEAGGILSNEKVVEYVNGVAPGVFVIFTSDQEEVHHELQYLKLGEGPYYVLYRPYHLASLETPLSIAKAYFDQQPTIAPWCGVVAETVTVAKKDLAEGEALDGIGGFTVYGKILSKDDAISKQALPLGLVDRHVVMKRPVKKGEIITYDVIEHKQETTIWNLRSLQDRLIK
ncbi:NAD(P)-dependent oxidoreductase [Radiobacillus kanasensis]|uniref:NAD(P)H-dependent oxidoreductase n=1 Tax=Radiobacillus kanasensis TaxID=2844358 RepID=UPI001E2DBABC|nr:NAD(P)-dependent oxidoreductase [Radiobacillus kanasensis]UFT98600.1 NAD(P)-dependent oxidoreductase [Radiobacillus kanasensis]